MTDTPHEHPDWRLQFLDELICESPRIADDVAKVSDGMWVIHGVIPIWGDVVLADFDDYDEAQTVLDQIQTRSHQATDP